MNGFAREWWDFLGRKSQWEDSLCDLLGEGEDYDRLATDDYDSSLEILGATNNWRLSGAQQEFFKEAGFWKVYVNHKDSWQTHYTLGENALPVRGWRRRYVSDATSATTNVIVGDENPGYYEISYWPDGWDSPRCMEWLDTGYMRIVPDILDPFTTPAPLHEPYPPAPPTQHKPPRPSSGHPRPA